MFQARTSRWDCISSVRGTTGIFYSTCARAQLQVIGAKPELLKFKPMAGHYQCGLGDVT